MHLELSCLLDNFSTSCTLFFCFFTYLGFLITSNSILKIMKNFDLNIENVLFLNWNFVFTIMIYNILMNFANFNSENWQGGGSSTICRLNKAQWNCARVWFSFINLNLIYAFIISFAILYNLKVIKRCACTHTQTDTHTDIRTYRLGFFFYIWVTTVLTYHICVYFCILHMSTNNIMKLTTTCDLCVLWLQHDLFSMWDKNVTCQHNYAACTDDINKSHVDIYKVKHMLT